MKDEKSELRKQAEAELVGRPDDAEDLSLLSSEAKDRLLYELRVHQIELEMQNAELRRMQLALEAARDKYSDLYDFAPVGYFTVNEKGMIAAINLTGASMLGMAVSDITEQKQRKGKVKAVSPRWQRWQLEQPASRQPI